MRFVETGIAGVVLIEPDVFKDDRGFFLETYHAAKYAAGGLDVAFVQDNHSFSRRGTLRGLHLQVRRPQGKLVRAASGEIWDVAVDLRADSPTHGQWTAASLSRENFRQLYVPPGCAHGFCVVSETADVHYKCTEPYDPTDETGVAFDDPALAIPWPVSTPVLSARDRLNAPFAAVVARIIEDAAAHLTYRARP